MDELPQPVTREIALDIDEFRIQVASDMHLELRQYKMPKNSRIKLSPFTLTVSAPILCLCGDVGSPYAPNYAEFLAWASANYKWIFIIAGNHEYYQYDPMHKVNEKIAQVCSVFSNVTYLENTTATVNYGGKKLRVFGSTFWSKTDGIGADTIRRGMNDYTYITYHDGDKRRRLLTSEVSRLHDVARAALEIALEDPTPMIVMTHHLPSFTCVPQQFCKYPVDAILNFAYASESDDLIRAPIVLWIFGHTHGHMDCVINDIRVVNNPVGYPNQENVGHIDDMSIIVNCC
jgi:predicted phosphodiesterase